MMSAGTHFVLCPPYVATYAKKKRRVPRAVSFARPRTEENCYRAAQRLRFCDLPAWRRGSRGSEAAGVLPAGAEA